MGCERSGCIQHPRSELGKFHCEVVEQLRNSLACELDALTTAAIGAQLSGNLEDRHRAGC